MTTTTENSTTETTAAAAGDARVWYPSDYRRAAAMLRRSRHVMGAPWQPKPDPHQDQVSTLAALIAGAFDADEHGGDFDAARFFDGTMLEGQATGMEPADADPGQGDGLEVIS